MSAEVYKNDKEENFSVTFKIFRAANMHLNQWKYYIIKKMSIVINNNIVLMKKKIPIKFGQGLPFSQKSINC
jgi:hypothetical protein